MADFLKMPFSFTEIGELNYPEFDYLYNTLNERYNSINQKMEEGQENSSNKESKQLPPSANHLNYNS